MKQREAVCPDRRLKIKTLQISANLTLDWCQRSASEILQLNGKSTPARSVPRVAQAVRGQHPDFRLVYLAWWAQGAKRLASIDAMKRRKSTKLRGLSGQPDQN
mmetsp:Transcript_15053/g.16414  ORF Transcript_15053/g.16414 Transcript_15053/m.16414 type:complete len:103 (-) Transcript_15053:127-435(-)